ncbi:MAG: hypothetical protein Q7U00_08360 [Sulfurimonas sp.]|nr:hypothetical protein [Sulfurimonas sp.]
MNNINVYIKESVGNIAKKGIYIALDIPEKKLNNVIKSFNCEDYQKSILAIYDNTTLGSAKEGLVFTGERLLYNNGTLVEFLYKDIESVKYIKDVVVNNSGKEEIEHFVAIKMKNKEYKLNKLGSFNYQNFADMLNAIINNFDSYQEENQLKTIAEMPDELKEAYLKIITNMAFDNDREIDQKELAELFLLMSRLDLSKDARFDVRSYISDISDESLLSVEELLSIIKTHAESTHYKSIIISLIKDMINMNFSTQSAVDKHFLFLDEHKHLFEVSDEEIDLAFNTVENDYKMINENLDDEAIKKLTKDLLAKATSVGVPLGAVYISGSVIGMSAAGMTSGLATLGMGGVLGLSSMATGIGVVILLGVGAYQGINYITGANQLGKYKTRELMLHEVIKQTQKTISQIIDDVNYVVLMLNDTISNHSEQQEKIIKLSKIVAHFQGALKSIDTKNDRYQNSINRLQTPKTLDELRLQALTDEPTKQPLYDFVIANYDEKTLALKENIETETLEKMNEVFNALGYFEVANALKGKASEGLNKVKGFFK